MRILEIAAISSTAIKLKVDDAMKAAMRAHEKDRLGAIRLIQAAFKQTEVDERITITDDVALKILDKMVKQRRESIKQFEAANRNDLADKEKFELTILQEFMPAALSTSEIQQLISDAVKQTNATTARDMGAVMAILKPQLQGRADMGEVSKIIKEMLVG
jgi:uncharacterized protein YqeY